MAANPQTFPYWKDVLQQACAREGVTCEINNSNFNVSPRDSREPASAMVTVKDGGGLIVARAEERGETTAQALERVVRRMIPNGTITRVVAINQQVLAEYQTVGITFEQEADGTKMVSLRGRISEMRMLLRGEMPDETSYVLTRMLRGR